MVRDLLALEIDASALLPAVIRILGKGHLHLGRVHLVDAASATGDTALHLTAFHGFKTVVRYLVGRGARLDATNLRGESPRASTGSPGPDCPSRRNGKSSACRSRARGTVLCSHAEEDSPDEDGSEADAR